MSANQLLVALARYRIDSTTEASFQAGVERVLRAEGITFEREVRLNDRDRIDFLLESGIGLELKTQGGENAVHRQLLRYAESDLIAELVLCTTRSVHKLLPRTVLDKALTVHFQGGIG